MRTGLGSSGFTITEVLVASAVLSVVVMTSLQVTQTMLNTSAIHTAKEGQIQLVKDIRAQLSNKDTCLSSMVSRTFKPSGNTDMSIRLPNRTVVSSAGSKRNLTDYGVRVTALQFKEEQKKLVATADDGKLYSAVLTMESKSIKGQKPFGFAPVTVGQLLFKVDDKDTITSCLNGNDVQVPDTVSCESMGGINPTGKKCELPPPKLKVACAPGEYMQSFDSSGNVVCRVLVIPTTPPPPPPVCRDQEVMLGMGGGASPRRHIVPCEASCQGTHGYDSHCAGGCGVIFRDFLTCFQCAKTKQVCN